MMNSRFIFFMLLVSFAVVVEASQNISASYSCNYNPDNNLVDGSPYGNLTIATNSEGAANYSGTMLSSPSIVKCDDAIPGETLTASDVGSLTSTFAFNPSANIDFTKSKGTYPGGGSYYKLKNTGSDFVDRYGYIHFRISAEDNRQSATIQFSSVRLVDSSRVSPNQGVKVDLIGMHFFTEAGVPISGPTGQIENISIELGTLYVSFVKWRGAVYDRISGSQKAYINLTIKPTLAESCSVSNETVKLPLVPAGNLRSVGDEIGGTRFNITASCAATEVGKQLMYSLFDNNATALSVQSKYFTNTVPDTSNVGITVYDDTGTRVPTYNTSGVLGILSGGARPSVTKSFLARYYKIDDLPVNPGLLNAQATIMVNYK